MFFAFIMKLHNVEIEIYRQSSSGKSSERQQAGRKFMLRIAILLYCDIADTSGFEFKFKINFCRKTHIL